MNVSPLLIEALKEVWTDPQCENLFWDSPGDGCKLCFVLQKIDGFAHLIGRDRSTHALVFVLVHCVWIFLSFLSNLPCRYAVSCQLQQRILPHTVCPVTDRFLCQIIYVSHEHLNLKQCTIRSVALEALQSCFDTSKLEQIYRAKYRCHSILWEKAQRFSTIKKR